MTSLREIRSDVMTEFATHATKPLDKNGKLAAKHVFDMTLKPFHARGLRQTPPVDVWKRRKFRDFILNETRKVAKEASKSSGAAITAKNVNDASVKVMTKTQKVCQILIKAGRLHFSIGTMQGEVCSGFLATHT